MWTRECQPGAARIYPFARDSSIDKVLPHQDRVGQAGATDVVRVAWPTTIEPPLSTCGCAAWLT